MLTIKQAMELAGKNLLNILSRQNDYLPIWSITIKKDMQAEYRLRWPEHNIGRWWDALLRLEAATGFTIPPEMETAMLRHLESCLNNPLSICAPIDKAASCFDDHSQREILLALAGLVRYRGSNWAAVAGDRMIGALDQYIDGDLRWKLEAMSDLAKQGGRFLAMDRVADGARCPEGIVLTYSHGRMIEALLEFYTATGNEKAIRLADRLARFHLTASTLPDGSVPSANWYIHTHSVFGTYRGLLLYGRLTRQHDYIDRIAKTYAATIRTSVKQSGFISHDWGKDFKGETTSPGDAAQLALWLAQLGYSQFWDDVERIVRARILPSQITAPLGLQPSRDEERHENLDDYVVGAFGGMHTHPHGEIRPTTDITAADLHTLCDIYQHIVEETAIGLAVNFHFDYEDQRVRIEVERGEIGRLTVLLKAAQPLLIRIPRWAPVESIQLAVDGQPYTGTTQIGNFLFVPRQEQPAPITLQYKMPFQVQDEMTGGVNYRISWRGDDVTGIAPNAPFLPFYPTASA